MILLVLASFYEKLDIVKSKTTPDQTAQEQKRDFMDAIAASSHFQVMFDDLPGVTFFAKNADLKLMTVNRAFLDRMHLASEDDLIGKDDFDLFPARLAEAFRRDDLEVMRTGKPKLQILELFFNLQGLPDWYLTNKYPVRGHDGSVIGVMGIVQSYAGRHEAMTPYLQLNRAVDFLRENFRKSVVIADLARMVGMSIRQFNRRFHEVFGTSPQTFLIKTRIQAACEALRNTDDPISDIALDNGFYDQSSFTLHFRKHVGMTPLKYRKE